jgi:hypothetical protein
MGRGDRRRQRHPRRLALGLGASKLASTTSRWRSAGWALLLRRVRSSRPSAMRCARAGFAAAGRGHRPRRAAHALGGLRHRGFGRGHGGRALRLCQGQRLPHLYGIPRSVDALLMVLLGGVQTVAGRCSAPWPIAGCSEQLMRADDLLAAGAGLAIVWRWCCSSPWRGLAGALRCARGDRHELQGPVLEVRENLRKSFGGVRAVDGVSFWPSRPARCWR